MPAEPKPTEPGVIERGFLLASGAPGAAVRLKDDRLVHAWSSCGLLTPGERVRAVALGGGEWCVLEVVS